MANSLTPTEISQILEAFFNVVGTRQYKGMRYVPLFGRKGEESIVWDNTKPYEQLTIVLYQGNSFTSRQYVPAGVEITNTEFWAETGNYNAQIEQYRREVAEAKQSADHVLNVIGTGFSETDTVTNFAEDTTAKIGELSTELTEIIMFGDSWADKNIAVNTPYVNALESALHCTMHDYAISGSGFVKPDSLLISTQVTNFLNSNIDKTKIKYCVFVGGVNDQHLNNVDNSVLARAIRNQVERIHTACPQCKILYVTDFAYPYDNTKANYWKQLVGYLQTVNYFGILNTYGLFSPNLLNSTNWYHLTDMGYMVFGHLIYSALTGAPINQNLLMSGNITSEDGNCTITYKVNPNNHGCSAHLSVNFINQTAGSPISARFDTSDIAKKIPWVSQNTLGYYYSIGAQYALSILDVEANAIAFACQSAPSASGYFGFNIIK